MTIVALGGAGKIGCIAVQDLAQDKRVQNIVIADTNRGDAEKVAKSIGSAKISIKQVDLNDKENLLSALKAAAACLNATVYVHNLMVMEARLQSRVHYMDMGGLFHNTRKQLEFNHRFAEAGVSAALGMGSARGVPNLQARYAADRPDTVDSIRIFDGIKPGDPNTVMAFENGEFEAKEPLTGFEDYWFTNPIGLLPMHYSLHSEVATLPVSFKDKGVKECFFKINYWGMPKETVEKITVLVQFGFAGR